MYSVPNLAESSRMPEGWVKLDLFEAQDQC